MTLTIIFTIIIVHWIADFVFQAEDWAINKSKNIGSLVMHTATYSAMWFIPAGFLFSFPCNVSIFEICVDVPKVFAFVTVTFVAHTITDYFTSKIVSKRFADNYYGSPIPNFGAFTIIGFDQILHYVQLFLTYHLLSA